jgi:hypothetical protein
MQFQYHNRANPDFLKRGGKQGDPNPTSQFHRKYYFGQEEEEMKLCLIILSVPWYMLNGLEHIGKSSKTGDRRKWVTLRHYYSFTLIS